MNGQGYEQLTLFQEDSHVSRFPSPGSKEAREMTAISGRRCSELYTKSGPLGSLVRMCLVSSIWHSTRCLLTWEWKVMKHKLSLCQLAVSTLHKDAIGSQLWPTPKANASIGGCSGARKTLQKMAEKGLITEEERRSFSAGNGGKTNPALLEWLMGYEDQFTKLMPTPVASDYKGAAANRVYTHTHTHSAIPASALRVAGSHSAWDNWPIEPGIHRVVDGIPNRVDRLKCLGNAVVPQQFYPFFAAIAEIEGGEQ